MSDQYTSSYNKEDYIRIFVNLRHVDTLQMSTYHILPPKHTETHPVLFVFNVVYYTIMTIYQKYKTTYTGT